jgi:DNA repair exonuclease SbcCD ATPase subunit
MSTKEAYKQKAEAELELAHARLEEFKAKVKNSTADAHINYEEHLNDLKHAVDESKSRLKELGEAGEDNWEKLKDGVENAFKALRKAIHNTAEKFKG